VCDAIYQESRDLTAQKGPRKRKERIREKVDQSAIAASQELNSERRKASESGKAVGGKNSRAIGGYRSTKKATKMRMLN